ncbi:hypothetical protein ABZ863_13535 [Saccharomonospora sp. NPDC046836]|uniref:hypothetical protein n=1 Tax=Saccharomonospora sp. NPDC046836 TaxID=3156921 RepID=UPI0033E2A5A2
MNAYFAVTGTSSEEGRRFSQEIVLTFQLSDTALQFLQPDTLRNRQLRLIGSRCMRLSDTIQAQTNGLVDRIEANPDDCEARESLVDIGRELAEQACGLLDHLGLDVSTVFNALDELIDSAEHGEYN